MKYCLDCENCFNEASVLVEIHTEVPEPNKESYYVCPYCRSPNYVEAIHCCLCGEVIRDRYIELDTGQEICSGCYTERCIGDDVY